MRKFGIVAVLAVVWSFGVVPAADASVPVVAGPTPMRRLAESRRAALRTAEALRGLTDTRLPVPAPNGRWLVTFADASAAQAAVRAPALAPVLVQTDARVIARRVMLLDRLPEGMDERALRALLPGASAVHPDYSGLRATAVPDDPLVAQQWAHEQAKAFQAWDRTTGDEDVLVAVIDSGVWSEHPDLRGQVVEQVRTETGEVVAGRPQNDACGSGHGTAVAGVIAAAGGNGTGVAGVAHGVKVLDIGADDVTEDCPDTGFTIASLVTAIDYAVTRPGGAADVINLSVGGFAEVCEAALQAVIDEARDAGAVVVAASGNEQESDPGVTQTPASCNGVIAVGATGRAGAVASYSQHNAHVDLVAPGGGDTDPDDRVLTTSLGLDLYERVPGTSFAAPYVSGVAALLRSVSDRLTPDQIESILESTAVDLGEEGRDEAAGWGLVDAAAAVARAAAPGAVPDPEPDPDFPVGQDGGQLPGPPNVPEAYRIDAQGPQDGVGQAVAISEILFEPEEAPFAVLARSDHFADALAGSGLAYGVAPLLFTASSGPLDPRSATELRRAVEPDSVVYLLGGASAIPLNVETELSALGFQPVRLAGASREGTAAAVALEIAELGIWDGDLVLLAHSGDWPDAITAGAVAAWYGMPVLLTPTTALHPATAHALGLLDPLRLGVLGGHGAITPETAAAAGDAGRVPVDERVRWAGPTRSDTAVLVAARFEESLLAQGLVPPAVVAVNVRHPSAYAPALGAAMIAGMLHTPFVPVEGADGTVVPEPARQYVDGSGYDIVGVGGRALLSDGALTTLRDLSRG